MRAMPLILLLIAAAAVAAAPEPAPAPAPAPPTRQEYQQVVETHRRAQQLIEQQKLDEATTLLRGILESAPNHAPSLYSLARIRAMEGNAEAAFDLIVEALSAGFANFHQIERDPALLALRAHPPFMALLEKRDEVQRLVAEHTIRWLRAELGDEYNFAIDHDIRLIFVARADARTLQVIARIVSTQAQALWRQLFDHRPEQYIAIVLPAEADFRRIVPQQHVGGFYNHERRVLIAERLGRELTHELVHALHGADLDPHGQEHATWVVEGLATLFETARLDDQQQLAPTEIRMLLSVQAAARHGRLIPLTRLVQMDQDQFTPIAGLSYPQAGALMHFLHERGQLRPFYQRYKRTFEQDPTGLAALTASTDASVNELERQFTQWLLQRQPPPAEPDDAMLGMRVALAPQGLRIVGVVPGSPADAAGLRRGDLLLSVDGLDVRDPEALLPLVILRPAGEPAILRIRRGADQLDLRLQP